MKKKKKEKGESMELGGGLKRKLLSHLSKDDKEFRGQIKDDVRLKKMLKKGKKED